MGFVDRLQHAWSIFTNKDPTDDIPLSVDLGAASSYNPSRPMLTNGNDRTTITAVYNRIAVDCSAIDIKHVMLDNNKRYLSDMDSGLNNCLQTEANIDQTARDFVIDIVESLLDEGCIAIVPTYWKDKPKSINAYDILQMRVGRITQWYPKHVEVELYNDITGLKERRKFSKDFTAIIQNPFYSVMNNKNSTAQRLKRKLALLDYLDEQSGSDKLNMIIKLPYAVKTDAKREIAKKRLDDIEEQLKNNKRGIAYIDSTENVTQLNRPIDNQLQSQVEYLTKELFAQLGITEEILNQTADDKTMTNYYSRTIEPIMSAIVEELRRKFLTKTARSQGQSIIYTRDPFKLLPVGQIADTADKMTRNEIMTSNEFRQIIGLSPAGDPSADELRNKNISAAKDEVHLDKDGNPMDNEQLFQEGTGEEGDTAVEDETDISEGVVPEDKNQLIKSMLSMTLSELTDE